MNDKPIRLFNSKQLTVSDALILVGFNARKLLAERGESFQITYNKEKKTILGDYGEPARIFINGGPANLDTKLRNKDAIHIEPAIPGTKKREISLDELVDINAKIHVNDHEISLVRGVQVNGELKNENYLLRANDLVEVIDIRTVEDLANHLDLSLEYIGFEVNGTLVESSFAVNRNDQVNWVRLPKEEPEILTVEDVVEEIEVIREETHAEEVIQAEVVQSKNIESDKIEDVKDEPILKVYHFLVNGNQVEIESIKSTMIFVDIFDHIDFDISTPKGILDLKLNGSRARYTDVLKTGDVIEIGWR